MRRGAPPHQQHIAPHTKRVRRAALVRAAQCDGIGNPLSQKHAKHCLAAMSAALAALTLQQGGLAAAFEAIETVTGMPTVVDGDTLIVDGSRLRLYGIDAPESQQQCLDTEKQQYACGVLSSRCTDQLNLL